MFSLIQTKPPPFLLVTQSYTSFFFKLYIFLNTILYYPNITIHLSFLGGSGGKDSACNTRDPGSIPGSGRPLGKGSDNPLQCSCLENPRDSGAWWAAIYGVTQSRTRLKQLSSSLQYSCLENSMDKGAWQVIVLLSYNSLCTNF